MSAATAAQRRAEKHDRRPKRPRSAFAEYLDANDAAGMPECAAWALAEEMAGLSPGDGIDFITEDDDR